MEIIHPIATAYIENYTTDQDDLLSQIEIDTKTNHPKSHMISGKLQGKFLEFISHMVNPNRILEIGTFTGYSALCLYKGLTQDGILHTIELRQEDYQIAQDYFEQAGVSDKIVLHQGNALDIIPTLSENWDLVFVDADKVNYIQYYELTLPSLRKGGWILVDNVLFHGQVFDNIIQGKNAIAIHAFNEYIKNDNRVEQVVLSIRDGITLIRKL
jgi:predicted O-methyltransferase YrrM